MMPSYNSEECLQTPLCQDTIAKKSLTFCRCRCGHKSLTMLDAWLRADSSKECRDKGGLASNTMEAMARRRRIASLESHQKLDKGELASDVLRRCFQVEAILSASAWAHGCWALSGALLLPSYLALPGISKRYLNFVCWLIHEFNHPNMQQNKILI